MLIQHRDIESTFKTFFAEIHREQLGGLAVPAGVSLGKDYRSEKLNPAHGFVGDLKRDKIKGLEAMSEEVAAWISNAISSSPSGAVTWAALQRDPNAAELVKRI